MFSWRLNVPIYSCQQFLPSGAHLGGPWSPRWAPEGRGVSHWVVVIDRFHCLWYKPRFIGKFPRCEDVQWMSWWRQQNTGWKIPHVFISMLIWYVQFSPKSILPIDTSVKKRLTHYGPVTSNGDKNTVIIDPGKTSLPPLSEPMLTYHQWSPVIVTGFHER